MKVKKSFLLAIMSLFVIFFVLPVFLLSLNLPELSFKAFYERYFLSDEEYCFKDNGSFFVNCPEDRCRIVNDYECYTEDEIENSKIPLGSCYQKAHYDKCVPK